MPVATSSRSLPIPERVKAPLRRVRHEYRLLTAPLRALPSTVIIGTQRGGTTSLFSYLAQHPDIVPPFGKEVHYFDLHYQEGPRWYLGRFPLRRRLRPGMQTMDATPYYMVHPLVPERVAQMLPNVKLIALLRNPIDRALSQYQHETRGGRESLSFAEAIAQEPARLAGEEERIRNEPGYYSYSHHRHSYTLRGRYAQHLRRWFQYFPRSQFLIVQSEQLYREPAATMDRIHEFIGVRPHRLARYEVENRQGNYERLMSKELRQQLADHFVPHNRELYQLLGEEFDWA